MSEGATIVNKKKWLMRVNGRGLSEKTGERERKFAKRLLEGIRASFCSASTERGTFEIQFRAPFFLFNLSNSACLLYTSDAADE